VLKRMASLSFGSFEEDGFKVIATCGEPCVLRQISFSAFPKIKSPN